MGYFRQLLLEYLYSKIPLSPLLAVRQSLGLSDRIKGRKYNLNILHFDVREENLYMLSADEQIELEELKRFIENNPHLALEIAISHRKDYLILRKELEIVLSIAQFLEARVNLLLEQTKAKG